MSCKISRIYQTSSTPTCNSLLECPFFPSHPQPHTASLNTVWALFLHSPSLPAETGSLQCTVSFSLFTGFSQPGFLVPSFLVVCTSFNISFHFVPPSSPLVSPASSSDLGPVPPKVLLSRLRTLPSLPPLKSFHLGLLHLPLAVLPAPVSLHWP